MHVPVRVQVVARSWIVAGGQARPSDRIVKPTRFSLAPVPSLAFDVDTAADVDLLRQTA